LSTPPSVRPSGRTWSKSFIPSIILVKTRRKSHKPTGSCGNFTGLWGKCHIKNKEKSHKHQMLTCLSFCPSVLFCIALSSKFISPRVMKPDGKVDKHV
jgi:hypothetical protein